VATGPRVLCVEKCFIFSGKARPPIGFGNSGIAFAFLPVSPDIAFKYPDMWRFPVTKAAHPNNDLRNWKLTLAYDGTDFQGWQIQPGLPTIQGELQAALGRITGETPLPQGSGRTDAGVHALAQVASCALLASIPQDNLHRALNRTLPSSIRILEATTAPGSFHARHSAIAKTYEYRVLVADNCSPFVARYVHSLPWPLNFDALDEAARIFEGEHDFRSFAATDPDLSHRDPASEKETGSVTAAMLEQATVKRIFSSTWERRQSDAGVLVVYRVRGNGFLHHMVRNLVGTMLDVGRGHLALDAVPRILAARNRSAAGPTAPPQGLFLHSVEYPPE
jgi:tRNA pseudouridine38-40 synthase